MKKVCCLLALASLFVVPKCPAISLDNIQLWTGSGTNRAALVVEWNSPEIINDGNTVPPPVATKTLVWGYRFNGMASGTQMFNAIVAANPSLYAVENIDPMYGTGVDAIGFNLYGGGTTGVTDGTVTDGPNAFVNGILIDPNLNVDAAYSLNPGDLYWSGHYGPYWQLWNELGDQGGFLNSPNWGTNMFMDPNSYTQGQWASSYLGLDDLPVTNGSWIGFSVSADDYDSDTNDPNYTAYNNIFFNDEQAPTSPDGTYVAYVANTNDFATQIISTNNIDAASPYNSPAAVLGRPTLRFLDSGATNRVSIIDDPYNKAPGGSDVITEIKNGGEITVQLGRKIYDDPHNPYGVDFIIYGNSFFTAFGTTEFVSDATDLNATTLSSGYNGHSAVVSVSQDGTNWYTYTTAPELFPDNAYRWDDTNGAWTDEEMNPTKPLNPAVYETDFAGQTVAGGLDQFAGAAGGTGYDLKASGFPWIQYVRIQPPAGTYTVIDAIAAVNPVAVGDALSITPGDLASGITNLVFQNPADSSQNFIAINFDAVSDIARVSTVALSDFSSFAPVTGSVSGAYQIAVQPVTDAGPVSFLADVGLRAGPGYTGSGGDLRVYQWGGTNWISQPFTFNPANNEALVAGLTNFSALVVSQIVPPTLAIQNNPNSFVFQFTPVPNAVHTLQRSTDLITWTPVATITPGSTQPVTLQDSAPPAGNAFYRLSLNVP